MFHPNEANSGAKVIVRNLSKVEQMTGSHRDSVTAGLVNPQNLTMEAAKSRWEKAKEVAWEAVGMRKTNRMGITNIKLRIASGVFTVTSLACFIVMVLFTTQTPTASATLIILACVWGTVCVPVGLIYQYILWQKQTKKKQSTTSTSNAVTWRLEWFIEWKYRLILLLLIMTVLFHMGLTTFVVQAANDNGERTQVLEQVEKSFAEGTEKWEDFPPGYLIAPQCGVAGFGIIMDIWNFLYHTKLIKYDNFDDTGKRHRPRIRAVVCIVVDVLMVACSIAAQVNKWNSGSVAAMIMCLVSLLYNIMYAMQAIFAKSLDMGWHIHAQHLQLQHIFVVTFAAAINIDQLIFSTMNRGFTSILFGEAGKPALLSSSHAVLVMVFVAAYLMYFCVITALVNLHSSVQSKLEKWLEIKIRYAEKEMS